jgi:hypothetical protein
MDDSFRRNLRTSFAILPKVALSQPGPYPLHRDVGTTRLYARVVIDSRLAEAMGKAFGLRLKRVASPRGSLAG